MRSVLVLCVSIPPCPHGYLLICLFDSDTGARSSVHANFYELFMTNFVARQQKIVQKCRKNTTSPNETI